MVVSVLPGPSVETHQKIKMVPSPKIIGDKNDTYSSVKDDLEITLVSEKSLDRVGDLSSETRKRGCSVASESRSRSSSVNSVDSGSSLLTSGDQLLSEVHREIQPSSQRFSIISCEDFNQELIVKPIKVKKKKKKRQGKKKYVL